MLLKKISNFSKMNKPFQNFIRRIEAQDEELHRNRSMLEHMRVEREGLIAQVCDLKDQNELLSGQVTNLRDKNSRKQLEKSDDALIYENHTRFIDTLQKVWLFLISLLIAHPKIIIYFNSSGTRRIASEFRS